MCTTMYATDSSCIFNDSMLLNKKTDAKINMWLYIKLRSFCNAKEVMTRIRRYLKDRIFPTTYG